MTNKLVIITHANSGRELVKMPMEADSLKTVFEKINKMTSEHYLMAKDEDGNDVLIPREVVRVSVIKIVNYKHE